MKEEVVSLLFHAEIVAEPQAFEPQAARSGGLTYEHSQASALDGSASAADGHGDLHRGQGRRILDLDRGGAAAPRRGAGRPQRPVPCGSGQKYKRCHGQAA